MKLIDIQRHFFRIEGSRNLYFCTEAESRNLNVAVVHYIRANKDYTLPEGYQYMPTQTLRGDDLKKIVVEHEGLGMAYRPASGIRKLDTQVPDSMGDDTHAALDKLKKAVGGDVTDFVCERLQWSREEIEERLFAEQVDSVALAIYNMEARNQAMIIGDQTGIGKGRMAACLIRYGHVQGQKPIFITEKSNLFTDIYRDLKDIGCAELRPFIINTDDKAKITELDEEDNIRVVYKPYDAKENKQIFGTGRMPADADYVLATYSQFNTPKRDAEKIDFLKVIAMGNTVILDEAHNAGGSVKSGFKRGKDKANAPSEGSNTFKVFADVVVLAKNVCFLSATFAKRPDNFPIFALRTCIKEADLKSQDLIAAISKGGEALQEILSSELVAEGQMLRRERTYDGIKVNYIYLNRQGAKDFGVPDLEKEHRMVSDIITGLMREIFEFEANYITPRVEEMSEEFAASGDSADLANKEMGVSRASYFSKVFNIVNQVLFSIKADAVAEHAIRRLKEDKKVVIACASTFESLYADLAENTTGDVKTDYSEALLRGLQNTLRYVVTGAKGTRETEYMRLSDLSEEAQLAYIRLEERIKSTTAGITISPIDYIIRKIERAGYRVAEVTGRSQRIEFTNEKGTRGRIVPRKKIKANVAFAQFQNNQQDVLIINTSGSTGASAHATNKGTNLPIEAVKQRVMIIAQCELNVSTEVQKRGRINRTGQIKELPPSYDYLISSIPAEARMMMMLQKKLRSLDANTASNQKNSTSVIDTEDFINKYGDEVVMDYMKENPDFTMAINDPFNLVGAKDDEKGREMNDVAKVVSGKVAVLSAEDQEAFYNTVMETYLRKVAALKESGDFDLEVEAMKLNAKFMKETPLVARTSGHSVFAEAAFMGTYECDVLRKPYSKEQVMTSLSKAQSEGDPKQRAEALAADYSNALEQSLRNRVADKEAKRAEAVEAAHFSPRLNKLVDEGEKSWAEIEQEKAAVYDEQIKRLKAQTDNAIVKAGVLKYFYAGRAVLMDRNTMGICLGCQQDKKVKNPFAPSNLVISFAVASDMRRAEFNLADDGYKNLLAIKEVTSTLNGNHDQTTLDRWDEFIKKSTADRELRDIITGNILKGFKYGGDGAKLITFTMENGEVRKGILLPKKERDNKGATIVLKAYDAEKCRKMLHDMIDDGNLHEVSLSQGFSMDISSHPKQIWVMCRDASKTQRDILQSPVWLKHNYGRGLYRSGKQYSMTLSAPDLHQEMDRLVDTLKAVGLRVELSAAQVEQYFAEDHNEDSDARTSGEWKPLKTDVKKIPQSKSKPEVETSERERLRLQMELVKVKIAIAKAKLKLGMQ